jgi:hypothetical protein
LSRLSKVPRTVEDKLREEYSRSLPVLHKVKTTVETEVRYSLLRLIPRLGQYERIVISARVKECESAVEKLKRQCEGNKFDAKNWQTYSLTSLVDLAAVRVMVFPTKRLLEADRLLRARFAAWTVDTEFEEAHGGNAFKYHGRTEVPPA